ncbi:Glycoside hydrolase 97 [Xylanibacter oryzae DSM 17970]|uniref:Glycoside hydrolase 97 n=1 Tax=Xylanibacter oryzae DSM 17970 TaxID=915438 RepID=A0ABN0RU77_9BACT|nr:glycoside hydrolase family 97 protein [Xylanibacter oryzae]EXG77786.1 Glycoside hydrolase 97 [Xylanibacter oryzae DSM 17970]
MKKTILFIGYVLFSLGTVSAYGNDNVIKSPDGKISVTVTDDNGKPQYSVMYGDKEFIQPSQLGIVTNYGDYSKDLHLKDVTTRQVEDDYSVANIKQSHVHYLASEAVYKYYRDSTNVLDIVFRVSNRDVAFRYILHQAGARLSCTITKETTQFKPVDGTTTFLCPQAKPMGGFAGTSPSYETSYTVDEAMGKNGWGEGYTFPCLFKNNNAGWMLISETGVDGGYCASRLIGQTDGTYNIGFPQSGECNGNGMVSPGMALPGATPWRTITLGSTLSNIVETTVPFDLVSQKYEPSKSYTYGKGSWSWIIGMDPSCNYNEQKRYIDFSAAMGYQSVLIDALWDTQIGRDKIADLAKYGAEKGVSLYLWYNSNGYWNDAPQSPRGIMNDPILRRKEMKWMQSIGIKGIKVDFFAGDKQIMMHLYESILCDANDYGLEVIFHGCTIPRGWERMYPNYVASEAVLASENLHFSQDFCNHEAVNACLYPFIRNTIGSMDFGGSALNKHYSSDNKSGTHRVTSDVYALATAVLFQSAVQHFALAPNNITDAPAWAIDFMKNVPSTWDEVKYIDGYPGKYIVLARRHGNQWFLAGVNAENKTLKLTLNVPMLSNAKSFMMYTDDASLKGSVKTFNRKGLKKLTISIPCNGGFVIKDIETRENK